MELPIQAWVTQAYETLNELHPVLMPELNAGPEVVRDAMMELQRRQEVCSSLLVETLQRTGRAKSRERSLQSQAALLRRTAQVGTVDDAYRAAQDDLDALKLLAVSIRTRRDILKSATQDLRAVARLVSDAMHAPNPGVPDLNRPAPSPAPPPTPTVSPEETVASILSGREFSDEDIRELLNG